jgi:hypothetical protein
MGGCVTSRFETRNHSLDDYNTLDIAFIGGEGRPKEDDICPVDKLFLSYNIDVSNLPDGEAKEVYEIFRINNKVEIEDDAEELARSKIKIIIKFIENLKAHIEKDGRRMRDFKKVLMG